MSVKNEFYKLYNFYDSLFQTAPTNPLISANILTLNNANSIKCTLDSIKNCVDEIIVVDGGSTDNTLDILSEYFCKIIINKDWQGFSHQRNLALKASKGNWILKIDSDEYLGNNFKKQINRLCSSKIFHAYKISHLWINPTGNTFYTGSYKKDKAFYPAIRLFRNHPHLEWKNEIHEYIHGLNPYYKKELNKFDLPFYHLDTYINPLNSRIQKCIERNKIYPGAALAEEYLPELFNHRTYQLNIEDKIF